MFFYCYNHNMIHSYDGEQNLGVFIILKRDSKILLGKRKNVYKTGWYGFPGGRLQLGESIIACATRELKEETGVKPISCKIIGAIKEAQEGYDFVHFAVYITTWDGTIQCMEPNKNEEWKWFDENNLPEPMITGHKAGLELLKDKKHIIDLHR